MSNNSRIHFEKILQDVNKFITLKPEERSEYAKDFDTVRDFLLKEMEKIDENFSSLYNGTKLSGSYADNLKISTPDEYDLIFRLKIRDAHLVRVEKDNRIPGNVLININDVLNKIQYEMHSFNLYRHLKKLTDKDGYLMQDILQSWIEGIVTKVLTEHRNKFQCKDKVYYLTYHKSGPAHTLLVEQNKNNRKISIDFVPGIVFGKDKWLAKRPCPHNASKTNWIAIPKPIRDGPKNNRSFCCSYIDMEQVFISGKDHLKNALRMLKKLRDRQNIQNLKSYFIKTVFLWEDEAVENGYWSRSVTNVLMDMFEKLITYVDKRNLPSFWNDNCNLFCNLDENQIRTMYYQLKRIYSSLKHCRDGDPEGAYKLFLTEEELLTMRDGGTLEQATESKQNGTWCNVM